MRHNGESTTTLEKFRSNKKVASLFGGIGMGALVLAGCGGNTEAESSQPNQPQPTSSNVENEPEQPVNSSSVIDDALAELGSDRFFFLTDYGINFIRKAVTNPKFAEKQGVCSEELELNARLSREIAERYQNDEQRTVRLAGDALPYLATVLEEAAKQDWMKQSPCTQKDTKYPDLLSMIYTINMYPSIRPGVPLGSFSNGIDLDYIYNSSGQPCAIDGLSEFYRVRDNEVRPEEIGAAEELIKTIEANGKTTCVR